MKRTGYFIGLFAAFVFAPHAAFAQSDNIVNSPLALMVLMGALALAPFVLIMVTSFVKISVVLSMLRQALGTQQIPPNQIINGLAIILTVYIMFPVIMEIKEGTQSLFDQRTNSPLMSDATTSLVKQGIGVAKEPLRKFMLKYAHVKDRQLFYGLAKRMRTPEQQKDLTDKALIVLVPSFVISQLKEAFQIGFLIFVPFIVIDMVVSNILMSMGMMMLSPTTISLPFKILLFILIDGWYLIARGLVLGYVPH